MPIMPLISRHLKGMHIAKLPGFPVCGIHYIWLHFFRMGRGKKTTTNPVIPLQFELKTILNQQILCLLQVVISGLEKQIYCHICIAFVFILDSALNFFWRKSTRFGAMKGATVFTITESCCFQICFHPDLSLLYFFCHFPQLYCWFTRKSFKISQFSLSSPRGFWIHCFCIRWHFFTQFPCLPWSPGWPGRPMWPWKKKKRSVSMLWTSSNQHVDSTSTV